MRFPVLIMMEISRIQPPSIFYNKSVTCALPKISTRFSYNIVWCQPLERHRLYTKCWKQFQCLWLPLPRVKLSYQRGLNRRLTSGPKEDLYVTLGVPETATKKEIKEAYLRLAKKYHPDANTGNPHAKEQFQKLVNAYDILSDDSRKQSYDTYKYSDDIRPPTKDYKYRRSSFYEKPAQSEFSHFDLPPNVKLRDVIRQIFIEAGKEEFIKNLEVLSEELWIFMSDAWKGDWSAVRAFILRHKLFVAVVGTLFVIIIIYPWIINVTIFLLWYVYYAILLTLAATFVLSRSPILVSVIIQPLHHKFMNLAKKAASRKQERQ